MKKNRYARKRQHIDEQKKKHAIAWQVYDAGIDERKEKRSYAEDVASGYKHCDPRNGGYQYWTEFYLSGPKSYAKECTNRKIRAKYRDLFNSGEDHDHIMGLKGSQYEKEFDFWWTVY